VPANLLVVLAVEAGYRSQPIDIPRFLNRQNNQ